MKSRNRLGEPLVTVEPVAEWLGVSKARVWALCREGILPHVRMGRRIKFCPDELATWAKNYGRSHPGVYSNEPL